MRNNRGAAIIFAVFMLVVFALIGAAIVTMLSVSSTTASEDLISTQAFFLAESGAEIRIMKAISGDKTSNDNYTYNDYNIRTYITQLGTDTDNTKDFFQVDSLCTKGSIKRKVRVKFWIER